MMRLTTSEQEGRRTTLVVEGWIAKDLSDLLEAECTALLEANRKVKLDLSCVAFVDGRGAAALRRLRRRGVKVVACPPFILEFVFGGTST